MEDIPSKDVDKTSGAGSSASPWLTPWTNGDGNECALDLVEVEVQGSADYAPPLTSYSDDAKNGDNDGTSEDAAAQDQL